jgi:hypothetical protein
MQCPADGYAQPMDRGAIEQKLELTRRHIAEGEKRIVRQWEIIQELEHDGHDATLARKALTTLLQVQEEHIEFRDRLTKMLNSLRE